MLIEAYNAGEPLNNAALEGGKKAIILLNELAEYLDVVKQPVSQIKENYYYPDVLKKMIAVTKVLGEEEIFTPMIVVAGIFSDLVKEEVLRQGAKTVVVNNGGDISLEIEEGHSLNIGIVRDLVGGECTHTINLTSASNIKGIATSGFGGRSLSKGIASAVTAFSNNCALADAAATSIANATYCKSSEVVQCLAEEIDHLTDLPGHYITCHVGEIDHICAKTAIINGLNRTKRLYEDKVIVGSVIYVKEYEGMYPEDIVQRRYS